MNTIEIMTLTSYAARDTAIELIDLIGVECVKAARLNTAIGIPDSTISPKKWPLIFECYLNNELEKFEIRILMMTSGYEGAEPHDMVDVLKHAGFKFDENDILQKKFDHVRWEK